MTHRNPHSVEGRFPAAGPRGLPPGSSRRPGWAAQGGPAAAEEPFGPVAWGTYFLLGALLLAGVTLNGETPTALARYESIIVLIGLLGSMVADSRRGLQNLIRPDLMALLALYFLTLFEFLFRQTGMNYLTDPPNTRIALVAVLWGFAGLAVGRHLVRIRGQPLREALQFRIAPALVILVFWLCFFGGFGYMLASVRFNPITLIDNFMAPRFAQAWTRGRYGDWLALLYETSMLIYLLPPLAGIIAARRETYSRLQRFPVILAFLFVLFYGFTGGTRNVFVAYLVTFLIGYAFALSAGRSKELIAMAVGGGILMMAATTWMLDFRTIGFKEYLTYGVEGFDLRQDEVFVDYNLYAICRLVEYFPAHHPYLGWEIPYLALIRPVPRVLWPGKPEGLSMTIENVFDVEGMTVSASFVGEAYMSGGMLAVVLMGIAFGALTRWWGSLGSPQNSELGILIYASGFFAAVISMRSIFVLTTALMPTLVAAVATLLFVRIAGRDTQSDRPAVRPAPGYQRP